MWTMLTGLRRVFLVTMCVLAEKVLVIMCVMVEKVLFCYRYLYWLYIISFSWLLQPPQGRSCYSNVLPQSSGRPKNFPGIPGSLKFRSGSRVGHSVSFLGTSWYISSWYVRINWRCFLISPDQNFGSIRKYFKFRMGYQSKISGWLR